MNPARLDFDPRPILARALRNGGVHADLFLEERRGHRVVLEAGTIREARRIFDRGQAVRILSSKGATYLASSSEIGAASGLELAHQVGTCLSGQRDRKPAVLGAEQRIAGPLPQPISLEARIALVQEADRIARSCGPAVADVHVALSDGIRRTTIARSDGRVVGTDTLWAVCGIEVVAQEGTRTETGFESLGGNRALADISPEALEVAARLAAERALRNLAARPAPAGTMPVILAAEAGGTFVHEAVGHPLEADLVLEGLSVFADRIGESIAAEWITVVDDATLPGQNGSFALDDEGVPAQRTVLIENGILRNYLTDERTGRLLETNSAGKGRRDSFRYRPIVRMSNTLILPGQDDASAILHDTPSGLYVVRMGGGEVDTITGHFVFEVSEAYRIRNGECVEPVRGATLTGETERVLKSIDRVASNFGFGIGTCGKNGQDVPVSDGEPTLRVPELVVGGLASD